MARIETLIAELREAIEQDYVGGATAEADYKELNHLINDYTRQKELFLEAQKALVDYVRARAKKQKE